MNPKLNPKMSLINQLEQGIAAAGLQISVEKQEKLVNYIELIHKWNAVHNLTAVRDLEEMVTRHLLDSLSLYALLNPEFKKSVDNPPAGHPITRVIDVGTGPGLPGIVLAICAEDVSFVLLDSHQKKMNFVQHVVLSLNLKNVSPVCKRVEQYAPAESFDWVVSRAFAALGTFIEQTSHLAKPQGQWVAMKGQLLEEELATLPEGYAIEQRVPVSVPGLSAERCLVFIKKCL